MAEMLLINPRSRGRKVRKNPAKKRTHARRRNPIAAMSRRVRRNPVRAIKRRVMSRRRKNPIGMAGLSGYMTAIREALMGGVGAVAFDLAHGQIKKFLPPSLVVTPGKVGAGDAVRAIITVVIGQALNGVTRGFSKKAAMASLTVQAHDLIKGYIPQDKFPLGYASPAMIAQGTNRVGPIRQGMNAYTKPGATPLLSAYTKGTELLNGARSREGHSMYR